MMLLEGALVLLTLVLGGAIAFHFLQANKRALKDEKETAERIRAAQRRQEKLDKEQRDKDKRKARKKKAAALTRKHTADAEKKEESKQTAAKMGGNKKLGKVAAPSKKGCSTGSLVAVAVVCVCGVLYQLV